MHLEKSKLHRNKIETLVVWLKCENESQNCQKLVAKRRKTGIE